LQNEARDATFTRMCGWPLSHVWLATVLLWLATVACVAGWPLCMHVGPACGVCIATGATVNRVSLHVSCTSPLVASWC
jgi:hypothetical protein